MTLSDKSDLYYGNFDQDMPCWYEQGCTNKDNGCKKRCQKYLVMNWLITSSGQANVPEYIKTLIPINDADEIAFDRLEEIKNNMVDFVEKGQNLYIVSKNLRNGKTSWAIKLMYRYFDNIWHKCGFTVRGYFLYVPEFLTKLKTFSYRETKEYEIIDHNLKTANLVIWDDISCMELTSSEQNILSTYINLRSQKNLSNIFTGYYQNEKLQEVVGERLSDRISSSIIVELTCQTLNSADLKIIEQAITLRKAQMIQEMEENSFKTNKKELADKKSRKKENK